ncbi:UDP-glucose 4-epimerase family protein [Chromobacterium violaceum]|uniref:UDP-glucose 4-epimerase family protein n=1 Tax=Chromobacterium violaceum TaxID=536 RepID=UPI001B33D4C5|nr:SDR family oxidoreductase [Chromobacterium violaceum]MBP4046238.1 SDR family oxidoreductase [Chromobacterium violaceum]
MMKVAITGANGFVGSYLSEVLQGNGFTVRSCVRSAKGAGKDGHDYCAVGDINAGTDWAAALSEVDVVVHTAARVHVMCDTVADPLDAFREVNVRGTLNLARQAVKSGVKRFIFVSSIKVNGEFTLLNQPFRPDDKPQPVDPYGVSKYEAECGLFEIARETGLEVVIVRPPLVYGPGVKGNFASMMKIIKKRLPLPLGAIKNNRRSMVSLGNLISVLEKCITHPRAVNQVFLVSDGEDLSTADLLHKLAGCMNESVCLINIPISILMGGASLLGRRDMALRLLGNLQVDDRKTRELLDWKPIISVSEGLRRAAADI